jgi:desulfoferrodoxin (superoxide reductase-like protein)/rubredoxin
MRYICVKCNYVFDESLWDREEGLEAGMKIGDIGRCPNCEEYDSFQWIKEEINYAEDYENLKLLEIEHIPQIKEITSPQPSPQGEGEEQGTPLSCKERGWGWGCTQKIEVFIWASQHPMWEDHRITSICLYDEYGDLVIEEFLLPDDDPSIEFDVSDLDEYEVVAKCSIHWYWWRKICPHPNPLP